MTRMVEDLANAAFNAACSREDDDIIATLNAIFDIGPNAPVVAMQRWMSRTAMVVEPTIDEHGFRLAVVADDDDPDDPDTETAQPADVVWTAQMFAAFCTQNTDRFRFLWQRLPPHQEFRYVHRVLTTMALTTIAYVEELVDNEQCCPTHRDPLTAAARLSMSHLN